MPVTLSAKKKLRQDQKRYFVNLKVKKKVKDKIKRFKMSPSKKGLSEVYSILDQAAKKNIYHKNKSARLKSRLSKLAKEKAISSKKSTTKSVPKKEK